MPDRSGVGGHAEIGFAEDEDGGEDEDHAEQWQRPPLEHVYEVMPESRNQHLGDDDDKERQPERNGPVDDERQGLKGKCAADAVHDEPADRTGERVQARRKDVAEKTERSAALDHHRHPELRAPRGEDGVCQRP